MWIGPAELLDVEALPLLPKASWAFGVIGTALLDVAEGPELLNPVRG